MSFSFLSYHAPTTSDEHPNVIPVIAAIISHDNAALAANIIDIAANMIQNVDFFILIQL